LFDFRGTLIATARPKRLLSRRISDQTNQHLGGAVGCKDMEAQQFFILAKLTFVHCAIESRSGFVGGTRLPGNIALNPYKLAICRAPVRAQKALVQYGIGVI
jgi:hypothetical protein